MDDRVGPLAPEPQAGPAPRPNRGLPTVVLIALIAVILVGAGATAYGLIHTSIGRSSPHAVIATPTATAIPPTATFDPRAPYTASAPGPKCDTGSGRWIAGSPSSTSIQCVAGGMQLSQPAHAAFVAEVFFYGPQSNYSFPQNYSISVDVMLQTSSACVGIGTREHADVGYGFSVCGDGLWKIIRYDAQGNPAQLTSGNISGSQSYHLQVAGSGASQDFSVNGSSLSTLDDATYSDTSSTSLELNTGPNGPGGSAVFSAFVYTPMR